MKRGLIRRSAFRRKLRAGQTLIIGKKRSQSGRGNRGLRTGSNLEAGTGYWRSETDAVPRLQPVKLGKPWLERLGKWIVLSCLVLARLVGFPAEELIASRISGRVTDRQGKPLVGAIIQVNKTRGTWSRVSKTSSLTDSAGRYELEMLHAKGQPLIVVEIFADAKGYVRSAPTTQLDLSSGEQRTLDFTLEPGVVLSGILRVPLSQSEKARGTTESTARRLLEAYGENLSGWALNARCQLTEPGGRFEMYLPPGEYKLRLHGYASEPMEWPAVQAGQTNVVLELPGMDWAEASLGRDFEQFWSVMDRNYSYFFLKQGLDWKELGNQFRSEVIKCRNTKELSIALTRMLEPLKDLHVRIETPDGTIQTYKHSRTYNGNFPAVLSSLKDRVECGKFAVVGRTIEGGFGCLAILRQSEATPDLVQRALNAMKRFQDAPGFIVDLRRANGGNEELARALAEWFATKRTVYAKSKIRNGPKHTDFSKPVDRVLNGNNPGFRGPIICLTGPGAISSGEAFVQMLGALPNCRLVGLPTRGASGNPRPLAFGNSGIIVHYSSWVDLMPDGTPFEGTGIKPAVVVEVEQSRYKKEDPTFLKAIELLSRGGK